VHVQYRCVLYNSTDVCTRCWCSTSSQDVQQYSSIDAGQMCVLCKPSLSPTATANSPHSLQQQPLTALTLFNSHCPQPSLSSTANAHSPHSLQQPLLTALTLSNNHCPQPSLSAATTAHSPHSLQQQLLTALTLSNSHCSQPSLSNSNCQ
jgi:hypothetical protein